MSIAYQRESPSERLLVVLNFTADAQRVDLSALATVGSVLLDTGVNRQGDILLLNDLALAPNEGLLISLPVAPAP